MRDANSDVDFLSSDRLSLDRSRLKHHTIVLDRLRTDLGKDGPQCLRGGISKTQQINVFGHAMGNVLPGGKQHRAFENEPCPVFGGDEPKQQALDGIAGEKHVVVQPLLRQYVEQAVAHRGSHIFERSFWLHVTSMSK